MIEAEEDTAVNFYNKLDCKPARGVPADRQRRSLRDRPLVSAANSYKLD